MSQLLNRDLRKIAEKPGLKLTSLKLQAPLSILTGEVEDYERKFVVSVSFQQLGQPNNINLPFGGIWGLDVYEMVEKRSFLGKSQTLIRDLLLVRLDPRDSMVKVVGGSDVDLLWEVVVKFGLQGRESPEWTEYTSLRDKLVEGIPHFTWMPLKEVKEIIQ